MNATNAQCDQLSTCVPTSTTSSMEGTCVPVFSQNPGHPCSDGYACLDGDFVCLSFITITFFIIFFYIVYLLIYSLLCASEFWFGRFIFLYFFVYIYVVWDT